MNTIPTPLSPELFNSLPIEVQKYIKFLELTIQELNQKPGGPRSWEPPKRGSRDPMLRTISALNPMLGARGSSPENSIVGYRYSPQISPDVTRAGRDVVARVSGRIFRVGSPVCEDLSGPSSPQAANGGSKKFKFPKTKNQGEAPVMFSVTGDEIQPERYTDFSCGPSFIAAVNEQGDVWMDGARHTSGTILGFTDEQSSHTNTNTYNKVFLGEGVRAVRVSCGNYHTIIVTDENKLLTWGANVNLSSVGSEVKTGTMRQIQKMSGQLGRPKGPFGGPAYVESWGGEDITSLPGTSLQDVLDNPIALAKFTHFCESEFSSDNLLFWLEITKWKRIYVKSSGVVEPIAVARQDALALVDKFLKGGMHTVALDRRITDQISSTLASIKVPSDLFDRAKRAIFSNMENDTYIRFQNRCIIEGNQIAVEAAGGAAHSAVLTVRGVVFTWGLAKEGQLGRSEDPMQPHIVSEMKRQPVIQLACGAHFTVAVTDRGAVYTWGYNHRGQTGQEMEKVTVNTPHRLEALSSIWIVQAACGFEHTLARSDNGKVYSWGGLNEFLELGRTRNERVPTLIDNGNLIASDIACGPYNSALVSNCGEIYQWGKNCCFGGSSSKPKLLDALNQPGTQHFAHRVQCGDNHLAYMVDETLTVLFPQLLSFCDYTTQDEVGDVAEFVSTLIQVPPELLGPIQDRVLQKLHKDNNLPYFTVNTHLMQFGLAQSNDYVKKQTITFRNQSRSSVNFQVNQDVTGPTSMFLIEPRNFTLRVGAEASFTFTLKNSFNNDAEHLVQIMASSERERNKTSRIFVRVRVASNISRTPLASPSKADSRRNDNPFQSLDLATAHIEIYEKLGGGGSEALVYRCTINGFTCAVKELTETIPEVRQNFLKEVQILERLSHENIVRYIGHKLEGQTVKLFMEYYPHALQGVIRERKGKPFTPKEIRFLGLEIAKGLYYLHKQTPPIIHRDIKSGNILLAFGQQGEIKTVKVTDFDVSAVMQAGATVKTVAGTTYTMAPEVLLQTGTTVQADIWSFGMLMVEIVTLDYPYVNAKTDIAGLITKGELPDLPPLTEPYQPFLKLIRECLVLEPERRPTAANLVYELTLMSLLNSAQ